MSAPSSPDRMQGLEFSSPRSDRMGGLEFPSPRSDNMEGVEFPSPRSDNMEGVEFPSPRRMEGLEFNMPFSPTFQLIRRMNRLQLSPGQTPPISPASQMARNMEGLQLPSSEVNQTPPPAPPAPSSPMDDLTRGMQGLERPWSEDELVEEKYQELCNLLTKSFMFRRDEESPVPSADNSTQKGTPTVGTGTQTGSSLAGSPLAGSPIPGSSPHEGNSPHTGNSSHASNSPHTGNSPMAGKSPALGYTSQAGPPVARNLPGVLFSVLTKSTQTHSSPAGYYSPWGSVIAPSISTRTDSPQVDCAAVSQHIRCHCTRCRNPVPGVPHSSGVHVRDLVHIRKTRSRHPAQSEPRKERKPRRKLRPRDKTRRVVKMVRSRPRLFIPHSDFDAMINHKDINKVLWYWMKRAMKTYSGKVLWTMISELKDYVGKNSICI